MILAIDTSTRYAGVALEDGGRVVACRSWHSTVNHTAELMPAVSEILGRQGIAPKELEAVAVALGPGGFSALRVGISVAKGLALGSSTPVIGVGSLDMEADPYRQSGMPVCALLEAGRSEAASAIFKPGGDRLRDDRVGTLQELVEEFSASAIGPAIFCGEGLVPWAEEIQHSLGASAVVCSGPPVSRVWALARLARQRLADGDQDDAASLQPNYLRMPSIGAPKRRDRTPQESPRRSDGAAAP